MNMIRKILLASLLIGFIIRVIISFSIEYSIEHGISSDDSYYYFRIAQNIANGYGSTFDLINKTNGYQPLVLLFLTFIYLLFRSYIFAPVIISQLILSVIATAAAYLTFVFVRRISRNEYSAFFSAILLFLNPVIIAINFKSLETNFNWLLILISVLFYEQQIKNSHNTKIEFKYFLFGLIIALAALSRLDGGFYILAFSIYILFLKKESFLKRFKIAFVAGLGFSIIFVPYLIFNYLKFDQFVPISGRAKVFHNHRSVLNQVGDYWSFDFFLYEIRRFIFPFNFDLFANRGFGLIEQIAVYVVIAILVAVIIYFIKSGYLMKVFKLFSGYGFIPIYLLFHYSFYTLYFWEYRFYYFLPEIIFLIITISIVTGIWIKDKFVSLDQKVFKILIAIIAFVFLLGGIKIFTAQHEQTLALKTAKWLRANLNNDVIIGSANSGVLSYFTQFKVVNLDGMVNNDELLNTYKAGADEYIKYLQRKNIKYLVDYFLSPVPENKYYFPELLNDKYRVIQVFTDSRLKYQKLNHMLVIKLNL